MQQVHIKTNDLTYPVLTCDNFEVINDLTPGDVSSIIVITDDLVDKFWGEQFQSALKSDCKKIVIQNGEQNKNLQTLSSIWEQLENLGADRKSLILNVGGGVVCDIGGFAAATFKRGVRFIHLPTTLLAQADAAIGGKTGIDFLNLKNNIGVFAQPLAVVCNVATLSTLSDRVYNEGWAEVIKHGFIGDPELLDMLASQNISKDDASKLQEILAKQQAVKIAIVSSDEKEYGYRKALNFGHTIGHALESLSLETDTPLLHGEAVALGMMAETYLAGNSEIEQELITLLKKFHLSTTLGLDFNTGSILEKISFDKKTQAGKTAWTLPSGRGKVNIDQLVEDSKVIESIDYLRNQA